MGKFHDTLGAFNPEELPDDWQSLLQNAYDDDFKGASDAVTKVQTDFGIYKNSSESEIKDLKAQNFELLMKQPNVESTEDNKDSRDKPITVKDLFGKD